MAGVEEHVAAGTLERLANLATAGASHSQARRALMDGADEATLAALAADDFELTAEAWAQFVTWIGYDPASDLAGLTVPTLAIFGEHDGLTPPRESQSILDEFAPMVIRTTLFPNAGHRLRVGSDYAPGYFDCLIDWCQTNAR
jgi:pimeloyl-ACP methyl ester carboxylesterase